MNIFIADPGADCFSPCPSGWLTRLLTSAVAGRVIISAVLKTAETLGPKVMRERGRREEEERVTPRVGVNKKGDKAHESRLERSWGYPGLERARFIVYPASWWMSFKPCIHFPIAESETFPNAVFALKVFDVKVLISARARLCNLFLHVGGRGQLSVYLDD